MLFKIVEMGLDDSSGLLPSLCALFFFFRCGSFSEAIQEVHLFLSARGGQTKLHQDPYSNIHCIFNGTKDWLLVHPDQTDLVYMSDDSKYEWGGYSEINVDSVDSRAHGYSHFETVLVDII